MTQTPDEELVDDTDFAEALAQEEEWNDALFPVLHEDGKGVTVSFRLNDEEAGTSMEIYLEANYPEPGLPNCDFSDISNLAVKTLMEFGHIVWPGSIPSVEDM